MDDDIEPIFLCIDGDESGVPLLPEHLRPIVQTFKERLNEFAFVGGRGPCRFKGFHLG